MIVTCINAYRGYCEDKQTIDEMKHVLRQEQYSHRQLKRDHLALKAKYEGSRATKRKIAREHKAAAKVVEVPSRWDNIEPE